jgi:hypothetical protein
MSLNGYGSMTKEQIVDLVSTALNKVFHFRGNEPKEYYKQFLKEFKTDSNQLITMESAYFGEIPEKNEQAPIDYDDVVFANERTTTAKEFALGFRITKSALIAMSKKPYGEFSTAKLVALQKLTAAMRDSIRHTKELFAVNVLLTPNSATKAAKWIGAGRDGKALAATDHPILKNGAGSATFSNSLTAESLSQSSVMKMITAMMTIPSPEGLVRGMGNSFTILTGPKQAGRLHEVLKTQKSIDNNYNNESVLNPYNFTPIVNQYAGADSTAYALLTSGHEIGYFAPVAPEFEDEEDFEVKGHKYSVYFQYDVDFLSAYDFMWNAGA